MKPGPLHAIARAELYTAKGSPKVDLDPLMTLLAEAPELPAGRSSSPRWPSSRGATVDLPTLPEAQQLDLDSRRARPRRTPRRSRSDAVAGAARARDAALSSRPMTASPRRRCSNRPTACRRDALTEWQQRVAWIYYLAGDDTNARLMAAKSAAAASAIGRCRANWVDGARRVAPA